MLWAITGTGFLLQESIDLMKELQEEYEKKNPTAVVKRTVVLKRKIKK